MTDDFPQLLKHYRARAGLSQNQLANLCGCDHSFLSRLEAGDRDPSITMTDAIAANLYLDPDEYDAFMGAAGYGVTNLRNAVYEPLVIDLDELIGAAPPDVAADLRATLRVLLRSKDAA